MIKVFVKGFYIYYYTIYVSVKVQIISVKPMFDGRTCGGLNGRSRIIQIIPFPLISPSPAAASTIKVKKGKPPMTIFSVRAHTNECSFGLFPRRMYTHQVCIKLICIYKSPFTRS